MTAPATAPQIGAVAIGRNEGARLIACIQALTRAVDRVVYVDSGSTDGSVAAARELGADVVELGMSRPFTAARARNEGLARLTAVMPEGAFVQFVDGDCTLREGWIGTARAHLEAEADLAIVCGRRRERFPQASLWNRLVDAEWDTPPGDALSCGGDALMRRAALDAVGGYRDSLIAGEEPEMCLRLRQKGWRIKRIDAEMTWHDAALTQTRQWWQRARRAGHAFGEVSHLHRATPGRFWVRETRRALVWGLGVPIMALGGAIFTPWALALLLAWPAQVVRLRLRGLDLTQAVFLVAEKIPEAQGVAEFYLVVLKGRQRGLIEYK